MRLFGCWDFGECRQTAARAQKLRFNGAFVSEDAFNMRKAHFNRKKEGVLREKVGESWPLFFSLCVFL